MEFLVRIAGGVPDLGRVERELAALDPPAVLDFDATAAAMRVSTWATAGELAAVLASAGLPAAAPEPQPSVCCGGCSFG